MPIYPDKVNAIAASPENAGRVEQPSASGKALNFDCGSVVAFEIAERDGIILDIKFASSGCGYMVAAGECVARSLKSRALSQIQVPDDKELSADLLAPLPAHQRANCISAALTAIQAAFADLRAKRVREFTGDSPLVCSCFGVDEATIEQQIRSKALQTVGQVTSETRAGGGCGSCGMLIQEMLDAESRDGTML